MPIQCTDQPGQIGHHSHAFAHVTESCIGFGPFVEACIENSAPKDVTSAAAAFGYALLRQCAVLDMREDFDF